MQLGAWVEAFQFETLHQLQIIPSNDVYLIEM